MCGIAGILSVKGGAELPKTLARMCSALAHRGPDSHGAWSDAEAGVHLGHRRLSIIDLSPQGAQPMVSASGRFVLVFNGEIYNYADLRSALEQSGAVSAWRGHSDSEVLLEAIEAWGLDPALQRAEGQMAFALWDRKTRTLHLARDRFGEKPLYYGWAGDDLVFASELKAIVLHPRFDPALDPEAVAGFFRYSYVPAPRSIYRDIRKLEAGARLSLTVDDLASRTLSPKPYWRLEDDVAAALAAPFCGSEDDAVEDLDALLRTTIKRRMISDVPLGALLSGGIDSSNIVALMQTQSPRPIKTFTIGTWDKATNEAEHAREVARVIGTEHTELYVGGQEALDVIPKLPTMYDEPFADSSQIPTHLVSALARRNVTVALSGDGGDEIFGGYNRYVFGSLWRRIGGVPRLARRAAAGAVHAVPTEAWRRILGAAGPLAPSVLRDGRGGDKLHKFADKLPVSDELAFQKILLSAWEEPESVLLSRRHGLDIPAERLPGFDLGGFAERAMYMDTGNYLPDDILVKVDRASMATSLEVRAPFLDTQVLRFAWSLPMAMKLQGHTGKRVLRRVLERHVPRALFERPKSGFAVPVSDWLRKDLRAWGETLLATDRIEQAGMLDARVVRRVWDEHQSGRRNWDVRLWTVLMFQAWLAEQPTAVDARPAPDLAPSVAGGPAHG